MPGERPRISREPHLTRTNRTQELSQRTEWLEAGPSNTSPRNLAEQAHAFLRGGLGGEGDCGPGGWGRAMERWVAMLHGCWEFRLQAGPEVFRRSRLLSRQFQDRKGRPDGSTRVNAELRTGAPSQRCRRRLQLRTCILRTGTLHIVLDSAGWDVYTIGWGPCWSRVLLWKSPSRNNERDRVT
jgi:hypothetical protein